MAGRMIAYFLVHRGPAPCFFSEVLYQALTLGPEGTVVSVGDISDADIRHKVQRVGYYEYIYMYD